MKARRVKAGLFAVLTFVVVWQLLSACSRRHIPERYIIHPQPAKRMKGTFIQRPWVKKRQVSHAARTHSAVYQTKEWKADRKAHLAANPLCVECMKEGRVEAATVSDHVIQVEAGGDMWNWLNRQSLCASHHNRKSARERTIKPITT